MKANTKDLGQAIDWQIALMALQDKASQRMSRTDRLQRNNMGLVESELIDALCEQPSMRLKFRLRFLLTNERKAVFTPMTSDFRLPTSLRDGILSDDGGLQDAKQQASRSVQRHHAQARLET